MIYTRTLKSTFVFEVYPPETGAFDLMATHPYTFRIAGDLLRRGLTLATGLVDPWAGLGSGSAIKAVVATEEHVALETWQRALLDDVAKRYKGELLAEYVHALLEELITARHPTRGVLDGRLQRQVRRVLMSWADAVRQRRSPGARALAFERKADEEGLAGHVEDTARAVFKAKPVLTLKMVQARYCAYALRHAGKDWTRQYLAERPISGREVAA